MASKQFLSRAKVLIEELAVDLKGILVTRLRDDKRIASGKLIRSVDYIINEIFFGVEAEISYLAYGNYFETGIAAKNIPFGGNTGKKTSKYIQGLVNWVLLKGLSTGLDKDPLGIAIAIAKTHKKKGWPLSGRINVLTDVFNEFQPVAKMLIDERTEEIIFAELDLALFEVTKQSKFLTNES